MALFRTQNKLLLAKVQADPDVGEAGLAVATDAAKVSNLRWGFNPELTNTDDEHTGSLDGGDPGIGGGTNGFSFNVFARGAGAAGSAPEWGKFLRGCGFTQTLLAAPVTGTAQAGTTSQVTLAAGASAVNDFYKGMRFDATGGTGNGQWGIITAYNGTTKVAILHKTFAVAFSVTTTYSIGANAMYRPASASLEALTLWGYQHASKAGVSSRLRKLERAAGTASFEIVVRQLAQFAFTFSGVMPAIPADVAHPGAATFDSVNREAFRNAEATLGGVAIKFSRASLDFGGQVSQADDPAAEFGYDSAGVTRRKMVGTLSPQMVPLATRDAMADFMAGTPKTLVLSWGSGVGKRVSVLCPAIKYTGNAEEDVRGFAHEGLPFQATGPDDGIWISTH